MATIYNSDLSKELQQGAKLQVRDKMPTELAEKVVPVMEVNPKLFRRVNFCKSGVSVTSGNVTLVTTGTDRETFVLGMTISYTKDVTCDMAISGRVVYVQITEEQNGDFILGQLSGLTLTAETKSLHLTFIEPIKLKKGSTIVLAQSGSYTAGLMAKSATVWGYTVEVDKA